MTYESLKGALSQGMLATSKITLNWRKHENSRLSKIKRESIINHKGARMVKDGEDYHGLQMMNLKYFWYTFQDVQTMM